MAHSPKRFKNQQRSSTGVEFVMWCGVVRISSNMFCQGEEGSGRDPFDQGRDVGVFEPERESGSAVFQWD
jgi:hypothetical protein